MTSTKEKKFGAGIKEWFRKQIVSLKRRPTNIPLVAIVIAFIYYSLHLTVFSNTTARIQGPQMGLSQFCTMLFSILIFVTFTNAYPKRQKVKVPMLVLTYVMFALILGADALYYFRTYSAVFLSETPIQITTQTAYIAQAMNTLIVHMVIVAVCVLLTALSPVFGMLLKKINTSVEVESYGELGTIDISGEN